MTLAIWRETHRAWGAISLNFATKAPHMLRILLVTLGLCVTPALALAQAAPQTQAQLSDLIDITALIDVMRAESRENALGIDEDLLGGTGGAAWRVAVDQIYDPAKLRASFDRALDDALDDAPQARAEMSRFFASPLGQRVVALEIAARRALLDPATETATQSLWDQAFSDSTPRAAQIERFAQSNDLIESNVMGAMNSNLAFYQALSAAGAFEEALPEEEMLAQVGSQEAEIRSETADWLYPFLLLAYQPLSDSELDQYIVFSESADGKRVNAAVFAAFGALFVQLSSELGTAAAKLMTGEEI